MSIGIVLYGLILILPRCTATVLSCLLKII
ncbi:hypothetical protein ACQ27_gp657 [Klebsiella phage K64-1]|nr:hypothetical protein ACQ27_gp657 [Klebsiella phage K64-1]